MRFLELAKRNLKENYRDLLSLGFLLAFPLIFMLLMGVAFGGESAPSYSVGIINKDSQSAHHEITQGFIDTLEGDEVETLEISSYDDPEVALKDLKLGDLSAYIVIPQGFGEEVYKVQQGQQGDITLNITYDESDPMAAEQIVHTIDATLLSFAEIQVPINFDTEAINPKTKITYVDFIAPGVIVFGLLILIPTSARMMIRDKEKGFLSRLLTTPTRPLDFITGYSLSMVVIAIAQIIVFVAVAWLLGMDIVGNAGLAFLIFLLTGLCCIGIGMIISSVCKSENQAESFSWIIAMPLAMLSGCWFSIEFMPSWLRSVAYAFSFSHAIDASRGVLTRGSGFEAITTDFLFLIIWTIVFFAVGVFLFRRSMSS